MNDIYNQHTKSNLVWIWLCVLLLIVVGAIWLQSYTAQDAKAKADAYNEWVIRDEYLVELCNRGFKWDEVKEKDNDELADMVKNNVMPVIADKQNTKPLKRFPVTNDGSAKDELYKAFNELLIDPILEEEERGTSAASSSEQ